MQPRAAAGRPRKDVSSSGPRYWYLRPVAALKFAFIGVPARAGSAVRLMSWPQRALLGSVLALVLGTSAYYFLQHRAEEHRQAAVQAEWKAFEQHAVELDLEAMRSSLDKIGALAPGDPLAVKRRKSLDSGEGDPADPVMLDFWMFRHFSQNHRADAVREAQKRIATVPDHWFSRCLLAHDALIQGRKEEAVGHLKALPSPMSDRRPATPKHLLYAIDLHRALQLDDSSLRIFRATKLIPVLKNPVIDKYNHRVLLQLLECYLRAFEDIATFPELPSYWISSVKLAQHLIEEPKMDQEELIRLGEMLHRQLAILDGLRRDDRLSASTCQSLSEEMEERILALWSRLRELNPKASQSYLGPAWIESRRKNLAESLKYLERGQKECGDRLDFLAAQSRLLRAEQPELALNLIEQAAERNAGDASIHRLVAEAALAVHRLDKALEACRQALKLAPDQDWAGILAARIYLARDRPAEALETLAPFKPLLFKKADVAELYVSVLSASDAATEMNQFLERLVKEASTPDLFIPALRAALRAGHFEIVGALSRHASERFPDYHRGLLLVLADSHLAWAEPRDEERIWNKQRVRTAIDAFEKVQKQEPNNLVLANNIAWLNLKGLEAADSAARAAEPLRRAEGEGKLTAAMLDTLGAVELANGHYNEARRLLLQAASIALSAGKLVHLARACYQLNDPDEAQRLLGSAAALPRSRRETIELEQALGLIEGKKR